MDVKLIAVTQFQDGGESPEALIEYAGRVCYRSEPKGNPAAFLRARLHDGHESIVEHASATFEIAGISRACSHQLVRHRIASYSQESQRYVDMADPEMVVPPDIANDPEALAIWNAHVTQTVETYKKLRDKGIRKEDARFVLPNATATRIIVTMNFREYLHFFRLRISRHAQWEIRAMAVEMLRQLSDVSPTIFGDVLHTLETEQPGLFD